MRLFLVRHGESAHNVAGADHSDPDPPLTELGEAQARRVAATLAAENLGAVALYAGPQRRALQTAAALADTLALAPHIHPDLCECGGLGAQPGLTRDGILATWPAFTLDGSITERGWWRGRESDTDEAIFYERARRAISWLRKRHEAQRESVVVVTHGRFGSALIATLLGVAPDGYNRFALENCSISLVDWAEQSEVGYLRKDATAVRLRYLNRLPPVSADMNVGV